MDGVEWEAGQLPNLAEIDRGRWFYVWGYPLPILSSSLAALLLVRRLELCRLEIAVKGLRKGVP